VVQVGADTSSMQHVAARHVTNVFPVSVRQELAKADWAKFAPRQLSWLNTANLAGNYIQIVGLPVLPPHPGNRHTTLGILATGAYNSPTDTYPDHNVACNAEIARCLYNVAPIITASNRLLCMILGVVFTFWHFMPGVVHIFTNGM